MKTARIFQAIAILCVFGCLFLLAERIDDIPEFRVKVDMVLLTITVTDAKGRYVSGLTPNDFRIQEDNRDQRIAAFAEGMQPLKFVDTDSIVPDGSAIFVLFDTSNSMYRGFSYASDAIADFVRKLEPNDAVAIYSFSRNLTRTAPLTKDRYAAIVGLRNAVAGAETALYNSILLTLRDAAKAPGRKALVVFSNGPDNASIISPDDVRAVAEDEGIPIYIVSTEEAREDSISANVFERLTSRTGGRTYWAKTWQKQALAYQSIREELVSAYTVAYYPTPNPNEGFRRIQVDVKSEAGNQYRVRARAGYRPQPVREIRRTAGSRGSALKDQQASQ